MAGKKRVSTSTTFQHGLASEVKRLHMAVFLILLSVCLIIQCCTSTSLTSPSPLSASASSLLIGGGAVLLSAICLPFVTPALRRVCLPFVPATTNQVANVMTALRGRSGTLIDLGSGDGRIVLEAARNGFQATGVELNPWLVLYSKFQARRQGLSSRVTFKRQDIFKTDLSQYDNVVIFGVDTMMKELETKCAREMEDEDSVVVACRFPFPSRNPDLIVSEGIDAVWAYSISSRVADEKSMPVPVQVNRVSQ